MTTTTTHRLARPLALLAAIAALAIAAACGSSVGSYCDYTDCSASPDAGVDAAIDAS